MLLAKARSAVLSCVDSTQAIPSRFLDQLGIPKVASVCAYETILFPNVRSMHRTLHEYESEYDFCAQPLSPSGLKSFLTCKRRFFYRYIQKIKEHTLPEEMSRERDIGTVLHKAIEEAYNSVDHYESVDELKGAITKALNQNEHNDEMMDYMMALWSEKLRPFYGSEIERFRGGNRIVAHEKLGRCVVEGIVLEGRMDRVENTLDGLEILDYKTGKFADTTKPPKEDDADYQLAAYALMGKEFGMISRCGYYDLNSGKIVYEQFLEEKIQMLRSILGELAHQKTFEWSQVESHTACRYCPYTILCQREG
jgi:RecB family exonuclease